jgi:hypothetical protein
MAIARFFAPDSGLPKGLVGQLIGKKNKEETQRETTTYSSPCFAVEYFALLLSMRHYY